MDVKSTPKTVLLVDDDAMQLEFYEAVLAADYNILTATSYQEAVNLLAGKAVDALVSDYHLSGGPGGMKILKWISENRPGLLGKTLMISGDLMASSGEYGVPILFKPVNLSELPEAVARIIENTQEVVSTNESQKYRCPYIAVGRSTDNSVAGRIRCLAQ